MKQPRVYEQLREDIYSNQIKPGEKLVERQLAERYKTSRAELRESLLRLMGEGLITGTHQQSSYVEDLTAEDVREIWLIRATLEPVAARLAAERPERGVVERLLKLADQMADEFQKGRFEASSELDLKFHREVVNASRSPRLIRAYDVSHIPMLTTRLASIRGDAESLHSLHREYALLIGSGNAARAEQFAREHVIEGAQSIPSGGQSTMD